MTTHRNDGLPELPEPTAKKAWSLRNGHMYGEGAYYSADQMRAYGEACRHDGPTCAVWLRNLHDFMLHCVSAADEGVDYAVPREWLDAMTTLGLMEKCGRGRWRPTNTGEQFAAWNRRASPQPLLSREPEPVSNASVTVGGVRVPDAFDGAIGSFTEGYQHGWNECRDEVVRMNTESLPGRVTQAIRDAIPMVAYAYDHGLVDAERVGRSLEEVLRLNPAAEVGEVEGDLDAEVQAYRQMHHDLDSLLGTHLCIAEDGGYDASIRNTVASIRRRLAGSGKEMK